MTLDDAIKHCQQVANESECECANEHKQLAEWLKELKKFRQEQTNEEWFSGMYTEAKAEWLADHMKCSKCPQQNRCNGYHGGCVALMLEWLKGKHNEIC